MDSHILTIPKTPKHANKHRTACVVKGVGGWVVGDLKTIEIIVFSYLRERSSIVLGATSAKIYVKYCVGFLELKLRSLI